MPPFDSLRGRIRYWEKRIDLEPGILKRRTLALAAWAEITRLAISYGVDAFRFSQSPHTFERAMQQAFAVAQRRRLDPEMVSVSPALKCSRKRARAARGGRGTPIR